MIKGNYLKIDDKMLDNLSKNLINLTNVENL